MAFVALLELVPFMWLKSIYLIVGASISLFWSRINQQEVAHLLTRLDSQLRRSAGRSTIW